MIIDATLGANTSQVAINFSGGGDNTIISALVNKQIKVLQLFLVVGGNTNLTFKSGSTSLSGIMNMLANGAMVLDYIQLPLTCSVNDPFIINSSSAVQVGGVIWFTQTGIGS